MKKLFLTGIGLLFAVTLTFAQSAESQEEARKKASELTERLQLTPEQQGSVHEIILDGYKQKDALKADKTITEEVKKERLKEGTKHSHNRIKEILTPEQKDRFENWVKEHKAKHKDH
ncbi:hypothetical protein [Sphingobacterium corticibacter]|nr:hypothetical protein [Sphingobacterium corticibacter]